VLRANPGPRTGWTVAAVAVLALLVGAPALLTEYSLFILSVGLTYGLLAMSLDLQWGYSGLINFGPTAAFGVGGYAYAVLTDRYDAFASAWLAAPAAVLLATAVTAALGYPAFKARALSLYYALLTLAGVLLLGKIALLAEGITQGSDGINGIAPLDLSIPGVFEFVAFDVASAFEVIVVLGLVAALALRATVTSAFGRALVAVKADEERAESLGYDVVRLKLMATTIAGAVAGLAGVLYVGANGSLDPTVFGAALAIQTFVWVAVGGQGTLWGPLVAAVGLHFADSWLSDVTIDLYLIIIAAVFLLVVLFAPRGIAGFVIPARKAVRADA
jgi:ABC-type branched-subunit amino acid transport system permease subunit